MQTDLGKHKAKAKLVQLAAKHHIELQIGKIKGRLPLRWKFVDVTAKVHDDYTLTADYVKLKIGFFSLFKGSLSLNSFKVFHLKVQKPGALPSPLISLRAHARLFSKFSHLRGKGVAFLDADPSTSLDCAFHLTQKKNLMGTFSFQTEHLEHFTPYLPIDLSGDASVMTQVSGPLSGPFQLDHLYLRTPALHLDGSAIFNFESILATSLDFKLPLFSETKGSIQFSQKALAINAQSNSISLGNQIFESATLSINASQEERTWQGNVAAKLDSSTLPLSLKSRVHIYDWKQITLEDLYFLAPESEMGGMLAFTLLPYQLEGALFAQSKNLTHFRKLFPRSHLKGTLGSELTFDSTPEQRVRVHVALNDFQYRSATGRSFDLIFEGYNLFSKPTGIGSIEGKRFQLGQLELTDFFAKAQSEDYSWPFELQVSGIWKDPFQLTTTGTFTQNSMTLATLKGDFSEIPFFLEAPTVFQWAPNRLELSDCSIHYPGGNLFTHFSLSGENGKATFHADHFPLEVIFIPSYDLSLHGNATIDSQVEKQGERVKGHLNALLEQAQIFQFGKQAPLLAKGSIQANLAQQSLQIHSNFLSSNNQFFIASASLPLELQSIVPFNASLLRNKPCSGQLLFDGHIEDIFDFIDLSSQELKGHVTSQLYFSNTLSEPKLSGSLTWKEGAYENYNLGTSLKEVHGHFSAKNQTLNLADLTAIGPDRGTFSLSGNLELNPREHFPFRFHADLEELRGVDFDTISAHLTGPLTFEGNASGMNISGKLKCTAADVKIPDRLPVDIPDLSIHFVNPPPLLDQPPEVKTGFPVKYDIKFKGEDHVIVRGRGLNSEWRGKTHILGEGAIFTAGGALSLIKGEFVFSGKSFSLTQGEITFSEDGAQINLSGNLAMPDLTITAVLSGPLSAPELTFQSIPQLPTSSILARIIFNKDISEITPFQAISLAQMIVTLSGDSGPNLLEKIRSSLGVDRFNIVSAGTSPEDIAIQIGKYLMQGVMVTFSQSAHSSQIIVEVELKSGFIFQAETQEEEEGKFSLKWNHNY